MRKLNPFVIHTPRNRSVLFALLVASAIVIPGCQCNRFGPPAPLPVARAVPPVQAKTPQPPPPPPAPIEMAPDADPTEREPLEEAPLVDPTYDRSFATERILIITPTGPLVIEFELAIDGWAFRELREQLIDDMLRGGDTDKNGKLTWDEALASPRFTFGRLADYAGMTPAQQQQRKAGWDWNKNGLVERDEIPRFLTQLQGIGAPFTYTEPAMQAGALAGSALWRRLDADGDRQLSFEEISAIGPLLSSYDTNGDELLQQAELSVSDDRSAARAQRESGLISSVYLEPKANWYTISYTLKTRFGLSQDKRVRVLPESFALDPTLVERLDRPRGKNPKNGFLEDHDLVGLLEIEPHIVVTAYFGQSKDRPAGMTVKSVWHTLGSMADLVEALPDGVLIKIDGAEIRITLADIPGAGDPEPQAKAQLAQLDANKDGYLEESEFPANEAGLEFKLFDADGDGKLYLPEVLAAVRQQQLPVNSRVQATVESEQHNLFAVIDANHDNALFPREIRQAAERLKKLDRNGDQYLTPEDLSGTFSVQLRRGDGNAAPGAMNAMQRPASTNDNLPAWFRAMDVNGDSELSRREFLGSAEQFKKLDANGDGFLDPQEAGK